MYNSEKGSNRNTYNWIKLLPLSLLNSLSIAIGSRSSWQLGQYSWVISPTTIC